MEKLNKDSGMFSSKPFGWAILLFVLLLLPNIMVACLGSDLDGNPLKRVAYLIMSILLVLLPSVFMRWRRYFLWMGVFFIFSPIEIGHVVFCKMPISTGLITSLFHTNFKETFELVGAIYYYLIPLVALIFFYYWVASTKIPKEWTWSKSWKRGLLLSFVLFNVGLWGAMWKLSQSTDHLFTLYANTNAAFKGKYKKVYPTDLVYAVGEFLYLERKIKIMNKRLVDFSFQAKIAKGVPEREIYVLVIGESSRYANFSVNGYHRKTSPNLDSTKNLISYSKAGAEANLTEVALQLLLTRATADSPHTAYEEKALTDAFIECGYKTAWLGNQAANYEFIQRITGKMDFRDFPTTDFGAPENYDEDLLPDFKRIVQENAPKQLIVLHLLGSHFRYNARYPDSFCRFQPALTGTSSYDVIEPVNKNVLVNSYDNTVCYTDFILSEIIQQLESTGAIASMVYISDHAENLYDDERLMIMHGNTRPSEYEIHIPFFFWYSDAYKTFFPEKVNEIEQHKEKRISTRNLFYSFLSIAGITTPYDNQELDITSPFFKEDSVWRTLTPDKRIIKLK